MYLNVAADFCNVSLHSMMTISRVYKVVQKAVTSFLDQFSSATTVKQNTKTEQTQYTS